MFEGVNVAPSIEALDNGVEEPEATEEMPELSPGQERALSALLVQPSTRDAAEAAQVGLRTLQGWLAEDENFNTHLRIAQREVLARMVQSLRDRTPGLKHQLHQIVNDPKAPATARVSASRALFEWMLRSAEKSQLRETEEKNRHAAQIASERSRRYSGWQEIPRSLKPLSGLQERAVLALMEHPTASEAARACGVGLRTLQQWMNHHDSFKLHYRNARRQAFARTLQAGQDCMPNIVECVSTIATSPDTSYTARVMAIRLLVDVTERGNSLLDRAEQLEADRESLAATERKRMNKALENKAFHDKGRERNAREEAERKAEKMRQQQQPDRTS